MSTCTDFPQSGQIVRDSPTTKKVNSLLNSHKTRLEGLKLLHLLLPRCPEEDFINFCVNWMQNCCKIDGFTKNRNCSADLLCNLLKTSSDYPELKKSVSFFITTRYFDFFFKYLLHSEAGWSCTEACLTLYRGACGPFQEGLEKHLTSEIRRNITISQTTARCFALLPSTGGGGNDGITYKQNWRSQFAQFLTVCHSILNDLFADFEGFQLQEYAAAEPLRDPNSSERSTEHGAVQFQNYCSVLTFMLLNQYPASKNVPCDLIFQLVCRGLALNPRTPGRDKTGSVMSLRKVLPSIHCALLSLLKAAVVTCKTQLLPYSHLICKLIKQSLQWTESDSGCVNGKQLSGLRIAVYETLCDWMVVARSGSCVEVISDMIVSSAVSDIRSKKGIIFLKEAKPQGQFRSRERTTRHVDVTGNSKLCHAALRTLQLLLKFTGVLLKAEIHKFLQEVIVKLLVEIQKSSVPDFATSFSVARCRTELYCLLLELIHQPCPKWPPPTHFALRLFARGLNDASPQVSSFCSAAVNCTNIIIHPQYDNGGLPPQDSPDNRTRATKEFDWREEPMDIVTEKGIENLEGENQESKDNWDKTEHSKKVSDPNEGTDFSSDEDSRNTITFSKDSAEITLEVLGLDEGRKEETSVQQSLEEDGSSSLLRGTTSPEKVALEKTSPPGGERADCLKIGGTLESDHLTDSRGPKSISPESANEDGHARGRYFLRSKTKGSSEEPEEVLKRTCSPESLKGTPCKTPTKMTPGVQNSKKRPRTRALSRMEGSGEAEGKTPAKDCRDDEEDVRAAFDDSFVD